MLIRSSSSVYNQSLIASLIERGGTKRTAEWCESVVANFARTPQGGDRDQVRAIAAGEGDLAVINHYYVAQMLASDGADRRAAEAVRVIFPDQGLSQTPLGGAHVNISGAGVVKTAPNRENAIKFIEYLLSDEAQKVLVSGTYEYPVAEGVAIHEILEGFGAFRPADVPVTTRIHDGGGRCGRRCNPR